MAFELVLEGNLFFRGKLVKGCVGVENGRIASVKKILDGDEKLDFGDKLVMPGAVDVHVHFREPGFTEKEDFSTGSASAACGGVTCVLDMPNTKPSVITLSALEEKLETVKNRSYVDFGLYAGINDVGEVPHLARLCTAFKIFMAETTNVHGRTLSQDTEMLAEIFDAVGETGKVLAIHAEDEDLRKKMKEKGLEDHLAARPNQCEAEAVKKVFDVAKRRKTKVHLCHISAKESIELISGSDVNLSNEVTPHHLFLDTSMDLGAKGKMNPPLRELEDREALWKALVDGTIETVASDHAPHTIEEKEMSFNEAPSGIPGVETMLPLLLFRVKRNVLPLGRLVDAICTRPAGLHGINKGRIEEGMDADFVVVNQRDAGKIKGSKLHSKCGWTPYEGFEAMFPEKVFLRGELVVDEGEIMERRGRYITR